MGDHFELPLRYTCRQKGRRNTGLARHGPSSRVAGCAVGRGHMYGFEHPVQALLGGRNGHKVEVIRHEAIRQDLHVVLMAVVLQPGQIGVAIIIREKDVLTPIPTLGNMMGHVRKYGSGETRHGGNMP